MALTTIPSELSSVSGISDSSTSTAITIDSSQNITFAGNITTGSNTISGVLSSVTGSLGSAATATTQAASDNSTKLATTAYVTTALANMVDSAPSTLNTLNELAAALGDDANFSTTVTNSIATKLPLAGGTLTGDINFGDNDKAIFGAGSDLQIYHDVTDSYISDQGSGNLKLLTDEFRLRNAADGAHMLTGSQGGAITAYHNGSAKLATTSTGIDVTGTVTATGNVGIGTSSPDDDLHIANTSQLGATFRLENTNISTDTSTVYGTINFEGNDNSAGANGIRGSIVAKSLSTNGACGLLFSTASAGGSNTERMRIDSSGNVGIGESDPSGYWAQADNLVVGGTGNDGITIKSSTVGNGRLVFTDTKSSTAGLNDGGMIHYNHTDDEMIFQANGSERMRIDSSGNVGIGVISPTSALDVATSSGDCIIRLGNGTSQARFAVDNDGPYIYPLTSGDTSLRVFTPTGSQALVIDSNGNVGIGTSNPSTKLHLGGTAPGDSIIRQDSTASGTNWEIGEREAGKWQIFEDDADSIVATFMSSGNVGIGTDNPDTPLTVSVADNTIATRFKGTNGIFRVLPFETGLGVKVTALNGDESAFETLAYQAEDHQFVIGTAEAMRIDSSGNLLVRQTSAVVRDTNAGSDVQAFWGNQFSSSSATTSKVMIGSGSSQGYVGMSRVNTDSKYITNAYIRFDNSVYTAGSEAGFMSFFTQSGGTNAAERMRIDSSGNVLVGCTDVPSASVPGFAVRDLSNGWIHTSYDSTNTRTHHNFFNPNGSVGTIQTSGSSTLYNTSSDQRLKDNIVDAPSASNDIDAIQVRSFDWKADGSHQKYGMVAQELQSVAPEAVSAPEDPEEMMGVDYSKLVPMLVKEIQSLRARVQQLENN